ncbi:MAG: SipW-dependent-type signal peptide-containing protein [Clostridia bacterium]|nr:SipW-dependent-type signal peptide-containing protein [Clostridia bacterium]
MTKTKSTKRALLMSALAMVLCVSMLIGTTFAWFTDSVTSSNNRIVAGNLDIELYYQNDETDTWVKVDGDTNIFKANTRWEPGHTEVIKLKISNEGSLALKYQLGVNIVKEVGSVNVKGDAFKLSDYIYFGVIDGEENYTERDSAVVGVADAVQIKEGYTKASSLESGEDAVLTMVVYMPTMVGNEANYAKGAAEPVINLGLNLFATQYTSETDSFGSNYDNGAPILNAPESIPATGNDLVLNGSKESNVAVSVPAEVFNRLDNSVTGMSVAASAPVVDTTNKTVTFETLELIDQNGKEIDLSNATAKVKVILPVGNVFADGEQVEIYHDGSFVTYATVVDGKLSYEVSHFCEVEVKAAEEIKLELVDNVLTINTVKEFVAFAAAVNAGDTYAGKTVVLGADLDLAGVTWTPIGFGGKTFDGTFDGNGKVIKNLTVLTAGKSNVGLFGDTRNGEIKNVTVVNAKVAGRLNVGVVAGQPYTTKYTNIVVKGLVEVDGLAYVGTVGGKNAYANWTNITVAVEKDSYVRAYSIENGNAYRTYVGGVVGFNGEGGHTFSNITSNIDVFGSTCDVGGAFGIAHYSNKFENITVTGNVTITDAEEAEEAEEMGGIAGVWHNENGTSVSFTNCNFTGKLSANVEADLYNNTLVGAAYNKTGNGTLIIDGKAYVAVNTADELVAALENKKNVIFVNHIKIDPANMSNAYGATGVNIKYGQTIDGNGYTLDIKGAGGTWDSGINTTGGVIKNIKVTGSFRGIFVNHNSTYSETVVLDNVTLEGVIYTISCDQGLKQNLVATNCTFNGWTSFAATIGTVKFENCNFGLGSGYKFCRPYASTEFVNCNFTAAGYEMDPRAAVTLEGCTFNGAPVTAENLTTLVTSNSQNATVK